MNKREETLFPIPCACSGGCAAGLCGRARFRCNLPPRCPVRPLQLLASGRYYRNYLKVPITGDNRTDVVAIALSQLGYQEGASNGKFSGEVSGRANYVESSYNMGDLGLGYGGSDYPWCASFVSWCLYQSRSTDQATYQSLGRFHVGDYTYIWKEISCSQWVRQLKGAGCYKYSRYEGGSYTPKYGDLVFFQNSGGVAHIGICLYVKNGRIYTVEGNTSDASGLEANGGGVYFKNYLLTTSYINGYGVLPYKSNASVPKIDYSGANPTPGLYVANATKYIYTTETGSSYNHTMPRFSMCEIERVCSNGRLYGSFPTGSGTTVKGYINNNSDRVIQLSSSGETVSAVDLAREELQKAVKNVASARHYNYTEAAIGQLRTAVSNAKTVLANASATEAQLKNAATAHQWAKLSVEDVTGRYVKLLAGPGREGATWVFFNEIEVYGTELTGTENIAWNVGYEAPEAGEYTADLTDGVAEEALTQENWLGFPYGSTENGVATVILDLRERYSISNVKAHFFAGENTVGAAAPQSVSVSVSADGENYIKVGNLKLCETVAPCWSSLDEDAVVGRYVKLEITCQGDLTLLNEVEVYGLPFSQTGDNNVAMGKEYTVISYQDSPFNASLTDGVASDIFQYNVNNSSWFGFQNTGDTTGNVNLDNNRGVITVDLLGKAEITAVSAHILAGANDAGATQPGYVNVYYSADGVSPTETASSAARSWATATIPWIPRPPARSPVIPPTPAPAAQAMWTAPWPPPVTASSTVSAVSAARWIRSMCLPWFPWQAP